MLFLFTLIEDLISQLISIPFFGIGSGSLSPDHIGTNSTEGGTPLKK